MEASFRAELVAKGLHDDLITYMETCRIHSSKDLANYIDTRAEIQDLLVDRVSATRNNRAMKAALTAVWRVADMAENQRIERVAKGVGEDDLEDPLPAGVYDGLVQKFGRRYGFTYTLTEILCEPLMARLRREIDRSTQTVIPIDRGRSAKESAKTAMAKKLHIGQMTLGWAPS